MAQNSCMDTNSVNARCDLDLPADIRRLLVDMYARSSGFSGPEIYSLFSRWLAVGSYGNQPGRKPSRWEIIAGFLSQLSGPERFDLAFVLHGWRGPMKYGPPEQECLDCLEKWILRRPRIEYL